MVEILFIKSQIQSIWMQQEAKLVIAGELDGQKHEFLIFNNQVVGEGGFGIVKKAIRNDRPHEVLVAKIIPYDNEKKRQKIQKQIDIIRKLPPHQNLVIVQPFKCYSTKYYYIFMEYCPEGTLEDLGKKRKFNFKEEQIFDIFYQIMAGYQVLWKAKILHQDLKPENILIKNGKFKLTDFGFSILHEGYKYGNIRQGTLPYMPLEKLTQKQYYASTKSDVYSLGIILFKIITGMHPYVNSKGKEHRQYLRELKLNPLHLRPHFTSRFSLKFQRFFDLVLQMISKDESSRIDFDKIYAYIEEQEIFTELKEKYANREEEKIQNELKKFTIVEESDAIAIPFQVPDHEQNKYRLELEEKTILKEQAQEEKQVLKLEDFIISQRIIVYFFDRLARRIYIQKLKILNKSKFEEVLTQKVMLSTLLFCKKIIQGLLRQSRTGLFFPIQSWKQYKKRDNNLINMIQRDEGELEDLIIDCLSESSQTKILERKLILDKSKGDFEIFKNFLDENIANLLKEKIALIDPENKNSLITISYILSGIDILRDFEKWEKQALELEFYFRKVETEDCEVLFSRVIQDLEDKKIPFTLDLGEVDDE